MAQGRRRRVLELREAAVPRFDFRCPKCRFVVEAWVTSYDAPPPLCCSEGCDGKVQMEVQMPAPAFHLRGGGWAADGYSKGEGDR